MRIVFKGKFFSSQRIWFETFSSIEDVTAVETKADSVEIQANPIALDGKCLQCYQQESLLSKIDCVEDLMQTFSSTTRNEIRRSEREGVEVRFYTSVDEAGGQEILQNMAEQYSNMYAEKGMHGVRLPIDELRRYAENKSLLISVATIEGKAVVYHSYVVWKDRARLLHSCSEFRVADNAAKNAIGRANRFLHYKDMEYLSKGGVSSYDWGGVSSLEQPNGIDKFKMSFGGQPITYYNIRYAKSLKQRIYAKIRR